MGQYQKQIKEHAFKKIQRDIKKDDLGNPLLLFGEEQYLIKWAIGEIISRYVEPAVMQLNCTIYNWESSDIEDLVSQCETLPMLSEKRIVVVEDFTAIETKNDYKKSSAEETEENKVKEFIEYVKSLPESCTLILVSNNADKRKRIYKAIAASGGCYEFDRLNDTDICAFVKKRLRQEGKRAKISLIRKMVEMTGYFDKKSNYTLYNLDNDIKKLIAHSEGSEISQHDLDVSLSQNTESYVFHMIDAISQNKKDVALTILHNLLYSGENWQKLLALICSGYELMLMVKEMLDQGLSQRDIKEQIGVHEYRIKIAARLSLQYSIKRIKQIICSCFDVDRNIKTGLLDERLALELLIASI